MTDGQDCGSLLDGARVLDASAPIRGGAALDLRQQPAVTSIRNSVGAWCTPSDAGEVDFVGQSAARTGGDSHRSRFGDPAVRTFAQILDEFRQSYVLRYSPQGVPAQRLARGHRAGPRATGADHQGPLRLLRHPLARRTLTAPCTV